MIHADNDQSTTAGWAHAPVLQLCQVLRVVRVVDQDYADSPLLDGLRTAFVPLVAGAVPELDALPPALPRLRRVGLRVELQDPARGRGRVRGRYSCTAGGAGGRCGGKGAGWCGATHAQRRKPWHRLWTHRTPAVGMYSGDGCSARSERKFPMAVLPARHGPTSRIFSAAALLLAML
eukprot:SAG22_NODE_6233_length_882_cov_1.444444_2_plen_176_part_01